MKLPKRVVLAEGYIGNSTELSVCKTRKDRDEGVFKLALIPPTILKRKKAGKYRVVLEAVIEDGRG